MGVATRFATWCVLDDVFYLFISGFLFVSASTHFRTSRRPETRAHSRRVCRLIVSNDRFRRNRSTLARRVRPEANKKRIPHTCPRFFFLFFYYKTRLFSGRMGDTQLGFTLTEQSRPAFNTYYRVLCLRCAIVFFFFFFNFSILNLQIFIVIICSYLNFK